jgi:hypothetical protein
LPTADANGKRNKKIRVVPCTVNIRLNVIESAIIWLPGRNSSALIPSASAPPRKKNVRDVIVYNNPTSVW